MPKHRIFKSNFAGELLILLAMAGPLMAAQLSKVAMVFTDTYMMGRLGAEALAGGGVGASIYSFLTFSFSGVISGISVLIAISHGARDINGVRRYCQSGIVIAVLFSALGILLLWLAPSLLQSIGQPPQSVVAFIAFTRTVAFALPGYLVFMALRNFVSALGDTKPIMVISIIAAMANLVFNLALINQWFGLPYLGLSGIGAVTAIVSLLMGISLATYVAIAPSYRSYCIFRDFRIDRNTLYRSFKFGLPVGLSFAVELSLFACAALMMGHFGVVAQGAHHIAMQAVMIAFAIPIILSSAVSYRVGQLVGEEHLLKIKKVVWAGLGCGGVASLIFAPLFLFFPAEIAKLFIKPEVGDNLLLDVTSRTITLILDVHLC